MIKQSKIKRIGWIFLGLILVGNIITYNQAYHFTHFSETEKVKTKSPEELNIFEKAQTLLLGISVPKPKNVGEPRREYETIKLQSYEELEAWDVKIPNSKGTIIMFHGYSSSKSGLLQYSEEFNNKGYSTLLVDFMGSGGSSGNITTVGFKESRDVKVAYEYIKNRNDAGDIILFGCSMGAVSIMKSIVDYKISPSKIILECPFGSFKKTTENRFEAMKLPTFPLANLLMVYGGLQLGFNPFGHKPTDYAKAIKLPTLLIYGAKDARVTRIEIDEIYKNLQGDKALGIMENSGHEVYLNDDSARWNKLIDEFIEID